MSATLQHVAPSGLLIIDKPQGVTSFDAVAAVRAALHIKKVGHAGTLDPMATGALVIAFGHATRLLASIVEHDKTYEATIRLGRRTTTDDAEGDFIDANGDTVDADTPLSRAVTERLARIDKNRQGRGAQVPQGDHQRIRGAWRGDGCCRRIRRA